MRLAGTPVCSSAQAGVQRLEQRLELVVAEHVVAHEGLVDEAVPADHVRERERERRVAAGAELEVGVGRSSRRGADRDRSRSPAPRASRSQWSCACGALAEGFAPQTTMHSAAAAASGSKPSSLEP